MQSSDRRGYAQKVFTKDRSMQSDGENHAADFAQPRVGVIDDDPGMRELLSEVLLDGGYTALLWDGVEHPVAFIARTQPPVILLDIRLGSAHTVWSVLDELDELETVPRPEVLVCSADRAFLREHGPALQERSCGIVEKPFDIDMLLTTVADCLSPSRR
jgi:DNA-binding NtrC family response regulator